MARRAAASTRRRCRLTFEHYRATVLARDAALAAVEADLVPWSTKHPCSPTRCAARRLPGRDPMGALTLQAEVCDWRRFGRAASFMGFVGLVPSEYSTGGAHPPRAISPRPATPTCGPSWSSPPGPTSTAPTWGPRSPSARTGFPPRWWPGRGRPSCVSCGRFRHLAARKNTKSRGGRGRRPRARRVLVGGDDRRLKR